MGVNRNKSSLVLDLKDSAERARLSNLIQVADVLVHNMRPIAMDRFGFGPEDSTKLNEKLVYCSITGFGSDGPYGGRPAYDDSIQAMTGLAWLQGITNEAPSYMATPVADKTAGMTAAYCVLAALLAARETGKGQHIEVPMFEVMASYALMEQMGGRAFVPQRGETGYARMRSPYRRPHRTADGYMSVTVYTDRHWDQFLAFVGAPSSGTSTVDRNSNIDEFYALVEREIALRPTAEWLSIFESLDIPAAPIVSLDELFDDSHLKEVGLFGVVQHPTAGELVSVRPATRFSGTPLGSAEDMRPAPSLDDGHHVEASWLETRVAGAPSNG